MKLLEFDETKIANNEVAAVLKQIDKHAVETSNRLVSIEAKMDVVYSAFPGGDFDGHRRYHQSLIDMLAERKAFYRSLKEKTFTGLLWAAVVWFGLAVWHELATTIKTTLANMK